MGRRGPQQTPTAQLENRGSWRAKHRGDAGEDRMLDLPDPPSWMKRPQLVEHWRMFGAHLIGSGVMKERFAPGLAVLCVAYQDFIECATGLSVKDMEKVSRRYLDALARHGLTPASAGSVSVVTKAKPTGLTALKLA